MLIENFTAKEELGEVICEGKVEVNGKIRKVIFFPKENRISFIPYLTDLNPDESRKIMKEGREQANRQYQSLFLPISSNPDAGRMYDRMG